MASSAARDLRVARLRVEQVHAMLDAGILAEGEPVELIDGLLVYKDRSAEGEAPMTIGKRHNLAVKLVARLDAELSASGCHIQTQGPLSIPPFDEPEPDGAILRGEPRDYTERLPSAGDAAAVIEVADASLTYDRTTKRALYARAGVAQYVIVNIREGVLEVYEDPQPAEERYARAIVVRAGEELALRVGGDAYLRVDAARLLP